MKNSVNRLLYFYNGIKVPQIGLGTYNLKGNDCIVAMEQALKIGYRHFDTAQFYSNSAQIAQVLKNSGIQRDEIFIASKIPPQKQGFDKTIKACETIISSLGIQYVDCFMILWPGVTGLKPEDPQNATVRLETYKALEELQSKGMIRSIGVSNFLERHLRHLLQNVDIKPVMNQLEIHPLGWDKATIEYCQQNGFKFKLLFNTKKGILVESYSPLAKQNSQLLNNQVLKQIAEKYNKTVAQVSLRWSYQKDFIIIPKSKTEKYLSENFNIQDFEISSQEMKLIDGLNQDVHTVWNPQTIIY